MKLVTLAAVSIAAISITSLAHATDFHFSFSNSTGNVSGTVQGEILGLVNNATSSATDVIITSVPVGLGPLPGTPFSGAAYAASYGGIVALNSFTVTNNLITGAVYQITNGYLDINLQPGPGSPFYNSLTSSDGATFVENQYGLDGGISFAAVVPEPAAWALMLVGCGLAGAALRRRSVATY